MKSWVQTTASAVALASAVVFVGCQPSARFIDPRPTPVVRYATERVSPAVVRLDVVTDSFSGGQAHAERSIGSGVIIDKEGHVLTNFHVAGRAKRLDITLANLEHVRAELVGSDHWTDLALVKLDLADLARRHLTFDWAPLGDSQKVELGQPVMALGTPFGLTRTLTAGIISNTDRFFEESTIDEYETGWFNNWLQMDAAINHGNSGGPLINLRGEVIGINTRGISSGNNLGFAIPSNVAKQVIAEILDHKKVRRSYVGVQLQPLQDLEHYYELAANNGVLIRSVEPESPAARAGVQPEDILTAINDRPVTVRFPEQLAGVRKLIADQPIGATMTLTIRRAGRSSAGGASTVPTTGAATVRAEETLRLTMQTERLESKITEEKAIAGWGISVRDLTRAYLRRQKLPATLQGVLVTGIRDGSPAQTAGMLDGDIILRVDTKRVIATEELDDAVAAAVKSGKPIAAEVRRDRSEKILVFKPTKE
ncbi:MAG: trypsin-like peptidase domain-containing protein [Phycisphaerae bacterium]